MKFTLLAAAALIAVPAFAQDTMSTPAPSTTMQTPPTTADPANTTSSDPSMMQQSPTTPQSDPSAPMDPAMSQSTTTATTSPTMTTDGDPVGGYQPSAPAMQGGMQPGATVRFQPAPSVAQAYPAPAPLASYPICKRGQYDNCRQRGGR